MGHLAIQAHDNFMNGNLERLMKNCESFINYWFSDD